MTTEAKPTCPQCKGTSQPATDHQQCRDCGWRFRVLANGTTEPWLDIFKADRTARQSAKPKRGRRPRYRKTR